MVWLLLRSTKFWVPEPVPPAVTGSGEGCVAMLVSPRLARAVAVLVRSDRLAAICAAPASAVSARAISDVRAEAAATLAPASVDHDPFPDPSEVSRSPAAAPPGIRSGGEPFSTSVPASAPPAPRLPAEDAGWMSDRYWTSPSVNGSRIAYAAGAPGNCGFTSHAHVSGFRSALSVARRVAKFTPVVRSTTTGVWVTIRFSGAASRMETGVKVTEPCRMG